MSFGVRCSAIDQAARGRRLTEKPDSPDGGEGVSASRATGREGNVSFWRGDAAAEEIEEPSPQQSAASVQPLAPAGPRPPPTFHATKNCSHRLAPSGATRSPHSGGTNSEFSTNRTGLTFPQIVQGKDSAFAGRPTAYMEKNDRNQPPFPVQDRCGFLAHVAAAFE